MTLPRVDNDTDFIAEPHVLCDKDGERLCAIVKATFELADGPPRGADGSFQLARKEQRRRIRGADIPWGKPEVSSIRYPSDLCVRKPGTDVIVVSRAFSPGGRPSPSFEAGVRLARVSKVVRITGPRVWLPDGDGTTEPRPTSDIEVRYDFAFGGFDDSDEEKPVEDARNPVGRGIACNLASLETRPAPQIEDPLDPVRAASARPRPAGLCAIGRHWEPRRKYWGTYDARWLEKRAPLPPPDFDDRANLSATPELVANPLLVGGEEGAITNLTPGGGTVAFTLPRIKLALRFDVKGRDPEVFRPAIDTVLLDTLAPLELRAHKSRNPDAPAPPDGSMIIELVWRASVRSPKRITDAQIRVEELKQ